MAKHKLIEECIEHSTYDIPESTQLLLKKCAVLINELLQYVPQDCTTCNHENCEDCDFRLDGWQMREEL